MLLDLTSEKTVLQPEVKWRRGALRARRDDSLEYGDRDETRDFTCSSILSQSCGVKVGSRSRMFFLGVGTEVVFFKHAQTGAASLDVL